MSQIIGFQDLLGFIGDVTYLKYSIVHTFTLNETVTGGTSGATAIVIAQNPDLLEITIVPTSTAYFQIGETLTGSSTGSAGTVLPSEATQLKHYHDSVKQFIEKITGKSFSGTVSRTETTTTTKGQMSYITVKRPLASLTSVVLDGKTLIENTDFYINLKTGIIEFKAPLSSPTHPQNLVVTYTYGTSTVPENIKTAAGLLISKLYQERARMLATKGATSISFGSRSVSFSSNPAQFIDDQIRSLLGISTSIRVG